MAAAGACTVNWPLPAVKLTGMYRWFWSKPCVTDGVRIKATFVIDAASGVCTVKLEPYWIVPGVPVIVGRAPLKRYGGE